MGQVENKISCWKTVPDIQSPLDFSLAEITKQRSKTDHEEKHFIREYNKLPGWHRGCQVWTDRTGNADLKKARNTQRGLREGAGWNWDFWALEGKDWGLPQVFYPLPELEGWKGETAGIMAWPANPSVFPSGDSVWERVQQSWQILVSTVSL